MHEIWQGLIQYTAGQLVHVLLDGVAISIQRHHPFKLPIGMCLSKGIHQLCLSCFLGLWLCTRLGSGLGAGLRFNGEALLSL